jgi:hypothetical protein
MSEETNNGLMESYEETNLGHASERQRESSGDDAGLERERIPREAQEAVDQAEDDLLGERDTLAGRKARYEEEDRQAARNEGDQHARLAELLDVAPEDLGIHKSLRAFSADQIAAAMEEFGLDADDLADSKVAKMLAAQMGEASEGEEKSDEEAEEDQPEKTDAEKEAEKAAEEKPVPVPPGKSISEFTPEERQAFEKHVGEIYGRSLECNSKPYVERFTGALTAAMQADIAADPQGLSLENTVGVAIYGVQAAIESTAPAVLRQEAPAIIMDFMRQNFSGLLNQELPGLKAHYQAAECDANWDSIIKSAEFKDAKLPRFESEEWMNESRAVITANPWFATFPNDPSLSARDALHLRGTVLARLMAGERLSPAKVTAQINEAMETGKRSAEKNNRRVSASRSLGSGRHHDGGQEKATSLFDTYTARNGGL